MTVQTMQEHEKVTLHHGERDFRRRGVNELARRLVRGPVVLDMRCLAGHLAVALAEGGHDVVGLDAYAPAVEQTNERCRSRGLPEVARLWDLTGLVPLVGEARFDTVLCIDVLNHARDDRETLTDILRVLRPGGRLVLVVPALTQLLGPRDRRLGHLRRYGRPELVSLLHECRFEVRTTRYWNALALPFQFFWERVLGKELRDRGRYGPPNPVGGLFRRLLTAWYLVVENRIAFPIGLSLVAVARKSHSPGRGESSDPTGLVSDPSGE